MGKKIKNLKNGKGNKISLHVILYILSLVFTNSLALAENINTNTNTKSSHQNMQYNVNFSLRLPLINRVLP
jgi:hypothetical protein